MKNPIPRRNWLSVRRVVPASIVALVIITVAGPVVAQTFFQQPTTPLGGTTASPLNSSLTTQRKAGSLLIGSPGATHPCVTSTGTPATCPGQICLNSDTERSNDTNLCISSWSQLTGAAYVIVQTTAAPPLAAAQTGYARIKGTANQAYTIAAEASSASNAAAIYGSDGGNLANFAGYFSGRVYVGPTAPDVTQKMLCLNGTDTDITSAGTDATVGRGCIDSWADVTALAPPASGTYVLLQATPGPTSIQTGGEALTGAGAFGSVVLGSPTAGTPIAYTCGDGVCNNGETNTAGANRCSGGWLGGSSGIATAYDCGP